ncbi:MAG: hypothetical protein AABX83_02850 [Nanoarchaeota archaeon]
MTKTFIAVRDVDEETFRKFKAASAEERMKLGVALTKAMRHLLDEKKKKYHKVVKNLLKVKPFDWGKGTERTSREIDEILYNKK